MRQCYHLISADCYKFWTVETVGVHYLATFGRIGTKGQTQTKTFHSEYAAREKANEMIDEKIGKGYLRVGDNDYPGASKELLASLNGKKVKEVVREVVREVEKTVSILEVPDNFDVIGHATEDAIYRKIRPSEKALDNMAFLVKEYLGLNVQAK